MASLDGYLKLQESESQIAKKILEALQPKIDNYLKKIFNKISPKIKELIIDAIKNAPEYSSLLNGQLKAEFGLPDSESRVNSILNFWENVIVEYKEAKVSTRGNLSGGFKISMIQRDFNDVLSSEAATFTTEKNIELNWLEWLLLFGNKTIIKDYNVELGPNPRSRTGMAIMKGAISGKWSVPGAFAGTINNNWITRAIDSVDESINDLLTKAIKG